MNAGIFLVTAVHYVATAAEIAITASAAEKPRHPRADRPPSPGHQNQAHRSARRAHGLERAANRSETGLPTVPASEWQTPHASTRRRTWPGPGSRIGN